MEIGKHLTQFTYQYHSLIEKHLEEYGRDTFPYYGAATTIVQIWQASDGFVTFYLEEPPGLPGVEQLRGYHLIDYSNYTLNTLCQSTSIRYLRVSDGDIGVPVTILTELPPDVKRPQEITGNWLSEKVNEALIDGSIIGVPLTGMMVSPIVEFKSGIRTAITPSRVKIWSPTIELPGKGRVRMYQWTHADFWWFPEQLPVDISAATELARNDLLALRTVLQLRGPLTAENAQQDMSIQAATLLERACDEFISLLDQYGEQEEKIHQWLYKPEHHLFLDLASDKVFSKLPFGGNDSDFVVRRRDGTYVLIEIEPASARIFQRVKQEPTKEFNHACQQVRDWQRYVRDNVHTVRTEQKLENIYDPRGMVIIGRTQDIDGEKAAIRWRDMKNRHELYLFTYDELTERVRALAASLKKLMHNLA